MANPALDRVSENTAFGFYYAIYYAILFFTTLFTTLREAPANDLYVFWHVPKRQYGIPVGTLQLKIHGQSPGGSNEGGRKANAPKSKVL